jgi:23S rRNA (cytosine1962-C5)-methyltransferase
MDPAIHLLASHNWVDYELLDSGDGKKLERFGEYTFIRPEVQAIWKRKFPESTWQAAHAIFQPSREESGGHWKFLKKVPEQWEMKYPLQAAGRDLQFSVMTTPGRHLGVFPECASHWDWASNIIQSRSGQYQDQAQEVTSIMYEAKTRGKSNDKKVASELNVLNLFGYRGLATLACAAAGARVTHVDASRKSITWAKENQTLSGMQAAPIRWIVDDAVKFVEREKRRGARYDGILLDPPKFGRGPKGEIWEVYKSLPALLQTCREILSPAPAFVVMNIYAVKFPAIHAHAALDEMMKEKRGVLECGELVTMEKSAGRVLSQATYARWRYAW